MLAVIPCGSLALCFSPLLSHVSVGLIRFLCCRLIFIVLTITLSHYSSEYRAEHHPGTNSQAQLRYL